jgi:hypothetical protein
MGTQVRVNDEEKVERRGKKAKYSKEKHLSHFYFHLKIIEQTSKADGADSSSKADIKSEYVQVSPFENSTSNR